jgi:multiple sugar transport system ATP-binding protein
LIREASGVFRYKGTQLVTKISLDAVTKRYGDVVALNRISLDIEPASFTSVFGPPGSGKTVLLRLILGLETVDAGRIVIDGKDVTNSRPSERNLSMVFQNLALFPHLSARDNIKFPLERRRVPTAVIAERVERIATTLGIVHILNKRPAALSGGERQRVAIARALIRDASAYLMDEPIAALDARLRDVMRVELKRLQTEFGHTFIYVTHDHEEAMSVADRMAILESGQVVQIDDPSSIYSDPSCLYVAELLGSPRINVLRGTLAGSILEGAHGRLTVLPQVIANCCSGPLDCVAAIRPESVLLVEASGASDLTGIVTDFEMLGAFAVASVKVSATTLRALVKPSADLFIGQAVGVNVLATDVMLFDGRSGMRIRSDVTTPRA